MEETIGNYFIQSSYEITGRRIISENLSFRKSVILANPDKRFQDLKGYHLAIIGCWNNSGNQSEADLIRSRLYNLSYIEKINIIDLGNLVYCKRIEDQDEMFLFCLEKLFELNIIPICIGFDQSTLKIVVKAYKNIKNKICLSLIDPMIDIQKNTDDIFCYLEPVITSVYPDIEVNFVGTQIHYVSEHALRIADKLNYNIVRLGEYKSNNELVEPVLRDSNIISVDINSIKISDAPAQEFSNSNGFSSEEICKISYLSGLSDRANFFAIHNFKQENDKYHQTAELIAQMIWYFTEARAKCSLELPENLKSFERTEYHVPIENGVHFLNFLKSNKTYRWWIRIDSESETFWKSCLYDDYQKAITNEVPEIYLRSIQKLNKQ